MRGAPPAAVDGRRIAHRRGNAPVGNTGKQRESAGKPGSVDGQPFLWDARHRAPQATYPGAMRATSWLPYLVLLRVGFTVPRRVATRAVRSYRTFSPLPVP